MTAAEVRGKVARKLQALVDAAFVEPRQPASMVGRLKPRSRWALRGSR